MIIIYLFTVLKIAQHVLFIVCMIMIISHSVFAAFSYKIFVHLSTVYVPNNKWFVMLRQFHVGHQVAVLIPTVLSKFLARWQRLCKVIVKVGRVNYKVHQPGTKSSTIC